MQRRDRTIYLQVDVRSEVRPYLLKRGIVEHGEHSQAKEQQVVGALAGALAELLCSEYGDTIEPSGAARAAMEAYRELIAENPILQRGDELPRDADRHFLRVAPN